jgi:hypothetical protein
VDVAEAVQSADDAPKESTKGGAFAGSKLGVKSGKSRKALPGRLRKKLANDKKKSATAPKS